MAIDGTTLKANAGKKTTRSVGELRQEIERLCSETVEQAELADQAECKEPHNPRPSKKQIEQIRCFMHRLRLIPIKLGSRRATPSTRSKVIFSVPNGKDRGGQFSPPKFNPLFVFERSGARSCFDGRLGGNDT